MSDTPVHGITGSISRLGVHSITVPYTAESFAEISRIVAENPYFEGLPRTDASYRQRPGRCYDVAITYEGITSEMSTGGGNSPFDLQDWEVIPEWKEEAMEKHPALEMLMVDYKGYIGNDDKVHWAEDLGLEQKFQPGRLRKVPWGFEVKRNPMLGRDTFFITGCVVRLTTLVRRVPEDAFRKTNRILKTLPVDDLAHVDWGDRDWLETDPTPRKRGNVIELVREFKMSMPGGWGPEMKWLIDQR